VLTLFARVTGLAGASIIVDLVDALTVVSTRSRRTLVDVCFASRTGPSRMTDTFMTEELVHTDSVQARIARAKIDFLMAAFAGKSRRTIAGEIGDQIGAIGSEQTRSLSAIIGIDLTALTFPSWQTIALVTAL